MAHLTLCLALLAQPPSPNLLVNSSFEQGYAYSEVAPGWSYGSLIGARVARVAEQPRSGAHALRLEVPGNVEPTWFQASQELPAPRTDLPLTLSAWVRTEDVRDGHGAYLSLTFVDGRGERLTYRDSRPLRGTAAYTRITATAAPPPGAVTMRAVLLLHGHGVCWFDDVQLEPGAEATDWAPSPSDSARAERLAVQAAEAEQRLAAAGYRREPGRNVAVLAEPLPASGVSTDPAELESVLAPAGYHVTRLDAAMLANPALLDPARFDLLILPCGDAFPAVAHEALVDYLANGGCLLTLGGYAFDRPLVQVGERWLEPDRLPDGDATYQVSLAEFDTPRPVARERDDIHALEVGVVDGALRLHTPALRQWATHHLPVDAAKLPAGWARTRLRAKADRPDTHLIVEWNERDRSRWQKVVTLGTDWTEILIPNGALAYWHDNPSLGRGRPGDQFDGSQAAGMLFGFSVAEEREGSELGVWIDWIRVEDDPYAELRAIRPQINARYGRIRDAMWKEPRQIGAFDPSHPLLDVVSAKAAPDQHLLPADLAFAGELTGLAATCVLTDDAGHGFGRTVVRLVPLVETYDRDGRPRGAALAIAYHYGGFYAGSAWAFCGVDNRDLFGRDGPLSAALPDLVERLLARVFLREFEAEYACYRPGETMIVRGGVSALGERPFAGRARLLVNGVAVAESPVRVEAHGGAELDWSVPVGADRPFIDLRLELLEGDRVIDSFDNGVVVWRDEDVRSGPAIGIRNGLLTFRGEPQFLVGSQCWWGQVGSFSARSPLGFKRDFDQMRALGFHISRAFLRMDSEAQRRVSDALVALGATHEVVIFHTPNLWPLASLEEQARFPEIARSIAERYRGVPNVVIDLCNEPQLTPREGPDLTAFWNDFLRARYTDDAGLRAAWGARAPERPLGQIPLPPTSEDPLDQRTADLFAFLLERHRQWARDLTAAVHAVDPARLVSVGHLPGHGWGATLVTPHLGSLDLDFTNRHCYGPVDEFPAQNAWIDQRLLGKPTSIGEFGARNHPGFGELYEDAEAYSYRHRYIVTHTFGMGGSFACSWHWRDPMEGIFPFGQLHADHVPRPVAAEMAALAQEYGALRPAGTLPRLAVMLPSELLLSGGRSLGIRAVTRCLDTLIGLHAPFAVIADVSLDRLPDSVEQLFCPVPFALGDRAYAALLQFVQRGGALVVTGDLRYTALRQPADERLLELCGVALARPAAPLDTSGPAVHIPAAAGFPAWDCHPLGELTARGASALTPVVFEHRLGRGRVLFVAAPLELERGCPLRESYARLLQWLGAERLAVTPDAEDLHVFRIDLADGARRYVVWNDGEAREVSIADGDGTRTKRVEARSGALL